jgi:radical SAM protein with 4Fe4S-binding SPASM domain
MSVSRPSFGATLRLKAWALYCAIERQIPEIKDISIEVTRQCNLSCRHCVVEATREPPAGENMAMAPLLDFLAPLASRRVNGRPILVGLTGGEPLLYPGIFELIAQLSHAGFEVRLVSNGTLISALLVEKLKSAGLAGITISFDGDETFTDYLKGQPGTYRRVRRGLDILREFGQIPTAIISCISSQNIAQLSAIEAVVNAARVKSWRIQPYIPTGRGRHQTEIALSGSDYRSLLDFVSQARIASRDYRLSFCCSGFLGPFYETRIRQFPYKCLAGINHLSILADGSISGCPTLTDRRFVVGHIGQDQLLPLWENGFGLYRHLAWKKNEFCQGCRWWSNCLGEGMHMWDFEKKRPYRCIYRSLDER